PAPPRPSLHAASRTRPYSLSLHDALPISDLLSEAIGAAEKIANLSMPAVMMNKEAVNRAYETTLAEGLRFERRLFHSMFALDDQDRKSTRLNSSHVKISYAVFCLKKKTA